MPSGGYHPGAGRPRKNPVDQQLEGKPASTAAAKPAVKNATYGSFPCKKIMPQGWSAAVAGGLCASAH